MSFSRMPRYDVRNDGAGPYAIFYCDSCGREFRTQPDVGGALTQDLGRQVASGLLRKVPLLGGAVANNLMGEDPRYTMKLTPQQLEKHWQQAQEHFRECPTCQRIVCLSEFDTQAGFCNDDSPRKDDIAESRGQQAGAAIKGIASAFGLTGLGESIAQAGRAAQQATASMAKCPSCGTLATPGTKFCLECGSAMTQPAINKCPGCGTELGPAAKFCPSCGTKIEAAQPKPAFCPNCGAESKGAKFCAECGTKIG